MKHTLWATVAILATGCNTVVNPFVHMAPDYSKVDTETLAKAAQEIEQAVREGNRDPQIPDRNGIVVGSDVIRQSIRTRAARFERLNEFLDTGHAMEGRNGLVYILRTKDYKQATTRKQRDRNALLVQSENGDRWALYEGIVESGDFPSSVLSAVQDTFYRVRIEALGSGHKYENESGAVVVKGQ